MKNNKKFQNQIHIGGHDGAGDTAMAITGSFVEGNQKFQQDSTAYQQHHQRDTEYHISVNEGNFASGVGPRLKDSKQDLYDPQEQYSAISASRIMKGGHFENKLAQ